MNNLDKTYKELLSDILTNGIVKSDRTGTGTQSVFGRQIRHKMSEGFPLITLKKIPFNLIYTELRWFLNGDTNILYLLQNKCDIWTGDAYAAYIKKTEKWASKHPNQITYHELKMIGALSGPISNAKIRQFTKEEFSDNIKTDDEFAKKWGDLGPIYGKQWKKWPVYTKTSRDEFNTDYHLSNHGPINQIEALINDLKYNPDSRRLMVNAWNVADIDKMTLPPCHYGFQVYTRELTYNERCSLYIKKYGNFDIHPFQGIDIILDEFNIPKRTISLMWNQRSGDTFLGIPFNIASYGLLLTMLADEVNMIPDELIGNLGDAHLYLNHIDQANEILTRDGFDLPILKLKNGINAKRDDIELMNYHHHSAIKAPLSN